MIIGTAGHIDHGKTSLVRALTGIDTDRLAEEKRRGITLELGFAYHTFANGARIGFVDVPGHEKLVHTMLAGVTGMDFILLVVAADEGVMPQTREHMDILSLLGQRSGAVVLSRRDLVDEAGLRVAEQGVRGFLAGSFLDDAPLFAVSARTGAGLAALADYLSQEAACFMPRPQTGRLRYAVDRVFTLKGQGTVVTGPVLSGRVSVGDTVVLAPDGLVAKVRSIHAQDLPVEQTHAGERAALNLTGEKIAKDALRRGMMVLDPFLNRPTSRFDARLHLLPGVTKPLRQWHPVRLSCATQTVAARLVFLQGESFCGGGDDMLTQIVTEKPVCVVTGDRFVVRDTSAMHTIGGGVVIDPQAPQRKRRQPTRLLRLAAMAEPEPATALRALLALPPYHVAQAAFCRARNLDAAATQQVLAASAVLQLGTGDEAFLLSRDFAQNLLEQVREEVQAFHLAEPDLPGIGLEKLRRKLAPELPMPCFRLLLAEDICAGRLKLHGAWLAHAGHEARLSTVDEAVWRMIAPVLMGEGRFQPPRTRDFAQAHAVPEEDMRRLLKSAARMGRLYEVAQDYFFPRPVLHEITKVMQDIAAEKPQGEFMAADLRDRLGNGRKVAILILEFFDRHGMTIRKGDKRRLNPHRLDLFQAE